MAHQFVASDITVVIPAYRAGQFIVKTLESVASQTILPHEIIVVDDGSDDDTCALVESFQTAHPKLNLLLLRRMHNGPGATRNVGIRSAKTQWIAFLDADDLWHRSKLQTVLKIIESNSKCNFIFHNEFTRQLNGDINKIDYCSMLRADVPVSSQLYAKNIFSTSTVVCRRDLLLASGGFDTMLLSAQDYDLWLRISPHLILDFSREYLGTYVLRKGNITTSKYWKRFFNILKIRIRHRKLVSSYVFIMILMRAIGAHLKNGLRSLF